MSKFKVGCNVKFKQVYHEGKTKKQLGVQTIDDIHYCTNPCGGATELRCSGYSYHFKSTGVGGLFYCEYSIEPAIDFIIRRSNR